MGHCFRKYKDWEEGTLRCLLGTRCQFYYRSRNFY